MSRKPRLKDQIDALLRGPAPAEQGDPDAFDGQHDAMALGTLSDDDVAAQPEGADAAPRARAGEKMRLRADIELPEEYQGRVVSRRKALKTAGARRAPDSADEGSGGASDSDNGATTDEDEDSEGTAKSDEDGDEGEGEEEEDEEVGSQDGEEEDEEEEEAGRENPATRELEDLEESQQANVMKLVQVASSDREKAVHARNQRALSDIVLEARIRLQKPLALAARLPRGAAMAAFAESAESDLQPVVKDARGEARGLVEQLLALRGAICAGNAALPNPSGWQTRAGGKRARQEEVEELWRRVEAADAELETFRDTTIDKWNTKVMLGSGAKGGTKFKALNQSVLTQTANVLQDMHRLVRRSRVKRSRYSVLGAALVPDLVQDGADAGEEGGGDGSEGEGLEGRRSLKEEVDEEAFDDTDFYQLLLRDLIESSSSSQASDLQQQLRTARRAAGKAGRVVDTKASKGRKLRYEDSCTGSCTCSWLALSQYHCLPREQ